VDAHVQGQHLSVAALRRAAASAVAAPLLVACGASAVSAPAPAASPSAPSASGLGPVVFLEDDAERAIEAAKRTGKLLFVDAWAPWCHSCLSMRAFVLGDPKLAALDDRFVWLAVDTEKDANAAFVARYPNQVYPTLWVVDPRTGAVVLEWPGTATASELASLLDAVAIVARAGDMQNVPEGGRGRFDAAFLAANQLAAMGDAKAAAAAYAALLERLPEGSPLAPRATEGAVSALSSIEDHARCSEVAAARGPRLAPGTSRATVLAAGLACARDAKRASDVATLEAAASHAANDPDPRVLTDDRSALFEELVATRKEAGDAEGARRAAEAWAAFLDAAASKAKTPAARAVFDAHRLLAYVELGHAERALPVLTQSERDFPDDYNPPARLARALFELGRFDEARAACARAAARVYGPRALRVLLLAADVAHAQKDAAAERAALDDALARTKAAQLTKAQQKLRREVLARRRLLDGP
jgi:tetratricopeptide (TPR) repeat protein